MNEPQPRRRNRAEVACLAAAVFSAAAGPAWFGFLTLPGLEAAAAMWALGAFALTGSLAGGVAVVGGIGLAFAGELRLWPGVVIFVLGLAGGTVDAIAALITFGATVLWRMAQ